jgi:uncharacterized protein (TIGR02466 family)
MFMEIINLFPTPVMVDNIGRDFTKEEFDIVRTAEQMDNIGNQSGKNSYILDNSLHGLKQIAQKKIEEYVNLRYAPSTDVQFYITQSWLNWTNRGEYHHSHYHQNSLISGVIYINATEDDRIYFHKNSSPTIRIETENYNLYNSDSWWIPVKTGDIILFPSELYHNVQEVSHDETRISLAFNVWVRGILGNQNSKNQLIL